MKTKINLEEQLKELRLLNRLMRDTNLTVKQIKEFVKEWKRK